LRIAILSRNPKIYSTRRLVVAGTAIGHQIDEINNMPGYINITSNQPSIRHNGKPLPYYDAVIPRIGVSVTFYGTSAVRHFEIMGTFSVNVSAAISRSKEKSRPLQLLSRKGTRKPKTGFAHHPNEIDDLIKNVGGMPVAIILLEGTQVLMCS
jgi:ribosomal protein S6--L-glutamate ligase